MYAISSRDIILVILVACSWGIQVPIIRLGVLETDPFLLNFLRGVLSAAAFLPFAPRPDREQLKTLFFIGIFFIVGNSGLACLAMSYITANSFAVLIQMGQPISFIIAYFAFREKIGLWSALGAAIAFMGILITFGSPDILAAPIGALACLLAATSWAAGSVMMKKVPSIHPLTFLAYAYLVTSPFSFLLTWIFEDDQLETIWNARAHVLGFVLFCQVFFMGLMMVIWQRVISRNPAQLVTPFIMLQPLITVIASHYILGETLNANLVAGGLIVIFGIGVINWRSVHNYLQSAQRT